MITAIIPARGGSKSIPKKNIVDIGGHPLIAYSIVACQLSQTIDRVIVSTDDLEISTIATSYGAEVPFRRPAELAQDGSTDVGFLKHFFGCIDVEDVALVRPSTPFRNPQFMDKVVEKYFKIKKNITGLRCIEEINENPYKVYQLKDNICGGFFVDFKGQQDYNNLPRQVFPKAYVGNGHIDIIKKETVLQGSAFGNKIYGEVCDKMIDIDDPFDLQLARYAVKDKGILVDFLKNKK